MSCKRLSLCLCLSITAVSFAACKTSELTEGTLDSGLTAAPDAESAEEDAAQPSADAGASPEPDADAGPDQDAAVEPGSAADAGQDAAVVVVPDGGDLPDTLEIEGRWHSNFGGIETFDASSFTSYGSSAIVEYDNEANALITQNPANATYAPSKFNKLVWTDIAEGSFFYCMVDYSLDSADAARNTTKVADATDPENGGCGGFAWTKLAEPIEIEGRWHSNFGGHESIDSDSFTSFGRAAVVEYDNASNALITRNPVNATYSPNKLNKLVWTELADRGFYYCTVDYDLDTLDAARNTTKVADDSDPENGGCGGFAWTKLDETIEIEGRWHSNFGGTEAIDSDGFTSFGSTTPIVAYDNTDNALITKNPASATYSPNKFNRIVWTERVAGSFYYCWVDFGVDTLTAALASTKTADASDPENGGCGGFAWTKLVPAIAVHGSWVDGTTPIDIDSELWGEQRVASYDATSAITQNPDIGTHGNEFNKLVWTAVTATSFYVCTVSMNQFSAIAAHVNAASADSTNLLTGCLSGPWTKLDAR